MLQAYYAGEYQRGLALLSSVLENLRNSAVTPFVVQPASIIMAPSSMLQHRVSWYPAPSSQRIPAVVEASKVLHAITLAWESGELFLKLGARYHRRNTALAFVFAADQLHVLPDSAHVAFFKEAVRSKI